MASIFLLIAVTLGLGVGVYSWRADIRFGRSWPGIKDWLKSSNRWPAYGHYLQHLMITLVFGGILSVVTTLSIPIFALVATIPSTALALIQEIWLDGHWKSFSGADPRVWDFAYDLYCRSAGAIGGGCFIFHYLSNNICVWG